jgi:hypothetical protein
VPLCALEPEQKLVLLLEEELARAPVSAPQLRPSAAARANARALLSLLEQAP